MNPTNLIVALDNKASSLTFKINDDHPIDLPDKIMT